MMKTIMIGGALVSAAASSVALIAPQAAGEPRDVEQSNGGSMGAAAVLRHAAETQGVSFREEELLALARQLGSANAATELLAGTVDDGFDVVVDEAVPNSAQRGSCRTHRVRYSRQIVPNLELIHHTVEVRWCWDSVSGSVTSVDGWSAGHGVTLAGTLQGYHWDSSPGVYREERFASGSITAKDGTRTVLHKARVRQAGVYKVCATGPLDWICGSYTTANTDTIAGYRDGFVSNSYNSY